MPWCVTNAYRVNASRKSFAQNHDIWTDFLVVHSQAPAGPCQAGLHLIINPQHLGKTQRTRVVVSKPHCSRRHSPRFGLLDP